MEFSSNSLDAEAARYLLAERRSRAATPKIPATTHRRMLLQRMRRHTDGVIS